MSYFADIEGTPQLQEISSAAGKKAHALRRAHQFDHEQARAAALKGVELRRRKKAFGLLGDDAPRLDMLLHGRLQ
jgi:hypothetical protein